MGQEGGLGEIAARVTRQRLLRWMERADVAACVEICRFAPFRSVRLTDDVSLCSSCCVVLFFVFVFKPPDAKRGRL